MESQCVRSTCSMKSKVLDSQMRHSVSCLHPSHSSYPLPLQKNCDEKTGSPPCLCSRHALCIRHTAGFSILPIFCFAKLGSIAAWLRKSLLWTWLLAVWFLCQHDPHLWLTNLSFWHPPPQVLVHSESPCSTKSLAQSKVGKRLPNRCIGIEIDAPVLGI